MDKGKPSKKKGFNRNRRREATASDKQINWKKVGKQIYKAEDQSDSDQDTRAPESCRYAKRKMKQPTSRLGDLDDIWNATSVGKNFEVLANAPLSTNSFVFKAEKNWALDVSKYDSYFSVDVKNLSKIINCIPFNKLVQVDDKYFTEDELTAMNNIAEKAEVSYKTELEISRQKALAARELAREQEEKEIIDMKGQSTSSQQSGETPRGIYTSEPITFRQAQEMVGGIKMNLFISSHHSDPTAGCSNMCERMRYLEMQELANSSSTSQSNSSGQSEETAGSSNANQSSSSHSCAELSGSSNANQPTSLWGEIPEAPNVDQSKPSRSPKATPAGSKTNKPAPSRRSEEPDGAINKSQPVSSRRTADKACGPDANQLPQTPQMEDKACGPDANLLASIRRLDGRPGLVADQRKPFHRSEEKARASNASQLKQLAGLQGEVTPNSKKVDDDLEFLLSLQEPVRAPPVATVVSPPKKSTSYESKTKTKPESSKPRDLENWLEMLLDD